MKLEKLKQVTVSIIAAALIVTSPVTGYVAEVATPAIIQEEGSVSDKLMANVTAFYQEIPENVRQRLENDGWQYICSSEDFGSRYGYNFSILALTSYDEKKIYIDDWKKAQSAIVHEVGHAVDHTLGWVSSSDEFNAIFAAEHGNVKSFWKTHRNNTDTAIEYFAESFQIYVQEPEDMQVYCPQTYTYIANKLAEL